MGMGRKRQLRSFMGSGMTRDHPSGGSTVDPSKSPEVSVVIPTRNRVHFLPRCLRAVLAQEDVAIEVIVVDDGSTDETATLLSDYEDERLRVVRLAERHGVARARNVGIGEAQGQWLAFVDDDDLWAPHKLKWQLEAAREAGADFAYGAAVVINEDHVIVRYGSPPDPSELQRALLSRNVIPGGCSNVIAKTGLIRRIGGFDPRLAHLADRDVWIRLAHEGRAAACPQIVVAYLTHSGNMRYQREPDGVEEVEYLLEKHRHSRSRHGVASGRREGYRYFARAQLYAGRRVRAASIFGLLALKERSLVDLRRAITSLVFGRGLARLVAGIPGLGATRSPEIEWLRERSPEEIEWLGGLTSENLQASDGHVGSFPLPDPDGGELLPLANPARPH
jgi:glycosyltransferase involved in cell wall biosynthesis